MSDARWLDVDDDIASAVKHLGNAVALYEAGGFDEEGLGGYRASMALMHALQSGHTSAEAALIKILRILGEEKPAGDDWRKTLVDRFVKSVSGERSRPALLTAAAANDLHETRRFRHLASHSYGDFDVMRSTRSIEAANRLKISLPEAVAAFRKTIDPE